MQKSIGSTILFGCMCILVLCSQFVRSDDSEFVKRANYAWGNKLFVDIFPQLYSDLDFNTLKTTYDTFKSPDFSEAGISGVVVDIPSNSANSLVDTWASKGLLSTQAAVTLKAFLQCPVFKTIKEFANVKDDNVIMIGVVGVMRLGTDDKVTLVYNFRKFKLAGGKPEILDSKGQPCQYWNIYCATDFGVTIPSQVLSGQEESDVFNYMRYATLKDFTDTNGPYIDYLANQAKQYEPFLSDEKKEELKKLEENPEKRPDDVLANDPFTPGTLDL